MMGRPHPTHGWLWLERAEWNATMTKLLEERDQLGDPEHVGPPPAFHDWVQEQLPRLAVKYRKQFEQRISDLTLQLENLRAEVDRGRLDLQPQADGLAGEINQLSELLE